jgi:hypothetical protein
MGESAWKPRLNIWWMGFRRLGLRLQHDARESGKKIARDRGNKIPRTASSDANENVRMWDTEEHHRVSRRDEGDCAPVYDGGGQGLTSKKLSKARKSSDREYRPICRISIVELNGR